MVLVMPEFVRIKDHVLNLSNVHLNAETCSALSDLIIAQTRLLKIRDRELEEPTEDENRLDPKEKARQEELRGLRADAVLIEHFFVDDCGMSDESLAILLGSMAPQQHLRTLSLNNTEFGSKSLVALIDLLNQKRSQEPFGLISLTLTNLKIEPGVLEGICECLEELTDQMRPVPQLKLSALDLSRRRTCELLAA